LEFLKRVLKSQILLIAKEIYEFGPFSLDAVERVLWRNGSSVNLTPKVFDTLLCLVRNQGRVLTKDTLLQEIWPDTFVEEVNLAVNISVLRKALSDSGSGREYIETVPRRGYRFIADVKKICDTPVQEPNPSPAAEPGASSLLQLPDAEPQPGPESITAETRPARRTWIGVSLALSIMMIAGALLYIWRWHDRRHIQEATDTDRAVPASRVKARRSVAILGFQNLSGQAEATWLSTALSEMLSTELAADGSLRTIPGEDVARLKLELPLAGTDAFSKDTLTRIRKNLGTDYVVVGSYTVLGDRTANRIRLDLRLQDSATGETVASVAETGEEAKLFELVTRAGIHLREPLSSGDLSPAVAAMAQTALPENPRAARFYAEGLEKLRVWDTVAARNLFEQSIALDSQFPLAHSALSSTWSALGYDEKAAAEAKKAFDLSAKLSREDRLLVEGRYRETQHEWGNAIGIYRALYGLFPDNLDYGLRLVEAQNAAAHPQDALATIDTLRRLPPLLAKDPRIDLAEAQSAGNMSDSSHQLAAATTAAQKGTELGARLIVADARIEQGSALNDLGRASEAKKMIGEGKDIYESVGDLRGVANSLDKLAAILENEGAFLAARELYERFGQISRQIGDRKGEADSYNGLTNLFYDQGDYLGSVKVCEQALPIYKEIDDKSSTARELNNCGDSMSSLGDLHGAMAKYDDSRQIYEKIGDKAGLALEIHNIATVLGDQGRLTEAKANFEQALGIWQGLGHQRPVSFALFNLGETLREMGNIEQSKSRNQEALRLRITLADKISIAESKLALADLSLEEGNTAEALAASQSVVNVFHDEKAIDDEIAAYLLQARIFLAQKNFPDANRAVQSADQIAAKTQDIRTRLRVSIVSARVNAFAPSVSKDTAEKIKARLTNAIQEAQVHELLGVAYEAQLALGDTRAQLGEQPGAKKYFQELEKRANVSGFGLIAHQARVHAQSLTGIT
jgi:eukaryotic-like serine/threonine-protein kinase